MKADKVLILSGVYRKHVNITVSGEAGRPVTFAAAPGHRVVIKGSEIVRGPWTRLSPQDVPKEPFPFAFKRVWKTRLGDEFFKDPRFPGAYDDKAKRWVSQVFWQDDEPHRGLRRARLRTPVQQLPAIRRRQPEPVTETLRQGDRGDPA